MHLGGSWRPKLVLIRIIGFVPILFLVQVSPASAGTAGFSLGLKDLPSISPTAGKFPVDQDTLIWEPPPEFQWPEPETLEPLPPFPARLWGSFTNLAVEPKNWDGADWRRLGLGVAAVGAVSLLDDEINAWSDRTRSGDSVGAIKAYRPLGQYGGIALLGLTWVAGRATDRPKLTAVAQDSLEATILAAGVITPLLKAAFGRTRPVDTNHPYTFGGSGESFPSGEATQAFAIASVVAAHSRSSWVKALAWGGAGLIGLGRVGIDGHWASDVVAGALIGVVVGKWVVRRNRPDMKRRSQVTWIPVVGRDSFSLGMRVSF